MPSPKDTQVKSAPATRARRSSTAKPASAAAAPAEPKGTVTAPAARVRRSAAAKAAPSGAVPSPKSARAKAPVKSSAKASARPVAATAAQTPVAAAVAAPEPAASAETPTLKKKELLSRVADLSGAKRKDAKPILEAALRVLGEALSKGEELNLPPLGKIRVNRSKSDAGTDILTLRLRRDTEEKTSRKGGKEGLAPEGEDD